MLCGDYKVTCNPHLKVDQYPLPKQEDLFVKLSGGKKFTKLGLSHAYNQVELEPTSRSIVTINTHFRPTHLVYGVSPVSPMFQNIMDQTLQGLDMVVYWVDDILVTGKDDQEHLRNLALSSSHFVS